MRTPWCLLFLVLLLTGCGTSSYQREYRAVDTRAELQTLLQQQYEVWAGTPYRFGGLDRRGVDCSGLVYRIHQDLFGLRLPRTTEDQVHQGRKVAADELQTADLVFFKTGWRTRHVGIYLGDGRFLHASTSRGVMISSLDNPYWQRHYWTSRRIPLPGYNL